MPQSSDYLGALAQYHPGVDLNSQQGLIDASNNASAQNMSTTDFVNKYNNHPDVLNAYNQKYQTLAAPQQGALDTQIGALGNQKDLYKNAADLSSSETNQQFDNANFGINQDAQTARQNNQNTFASYGPALQGAFAGADSRINANTDQQLSYAKNNRANALAGIALNNASQNTQLSGSIGQLQAQKGALNYQTSTNAQDAYNQNTTDQFNRQNALFNDSLKLPQGRTISTGPGLTVQGSSTDPSGFMGALSKLVPVLQTMGPQGAAFAKSFLPGMATQYGVTLSGDGLNNLSSSFGSGQEPSGGGGGSSYQPAAPERQAQAPAAPSFGPSQQQEATSQISQLSGRSDYASNPNKYITLLQQNYPGISYEQAYSIYRGAVKQAPAAASVPPSGYSYQNTGSLDLGGNVYA